MLRKNILVGEGGEMKLKRIMRDSSIPKPMLDVAWSRVEGFLGHVTLHPDMTIKNLMQSCYIQGFHDAVDAGAKKNKHR